MTGNSPAHFSELEDLERKWESITEEPEKPRSTMNVIEYGLGQQKRAEVYINRLLCYLLDPANPHGMGTEFLNAFLESMPESMEFVEDTYDLSNVRVNEQVTIEGEDSRGYADLVIDSPEEWFLLVELKFSAKETGTKFYAHASQIGDKPAESYESGQYYLYLHRHDKPTATSDEFTNWTWRAFVETVLNEKIADSVPRYPQRTATQLHDLKDDLKTITNMTEQQTAEQKKIELYLEHVDAIEDVSSTFDNAWESYSEKWDRELAEALDNADNSVRRNTGDEYPEVVVPRTDHENDRWILRATGGDWQHLHKFGWYRHEQTLDPLTDRANNKNDLRIGYYFRMEKHREAAVHNHELHFHYRNMGSNPTDFKDLYEEKFYEKEEEVESCLTGTNGNLTGNKLTLIEATYNIPVKQYEDFFDAYTAALENAFVDFVIENPELIQILSETFENAVEEYR